MSPSYIFLKLRVHAVLSIHWNYVFDHTKQSTVWVLCGLKYRGFFERSDVNHTVLCLVKSTKIVVTHRQDSVTKLPCSSPPPSLCSLCIMP